MASTLLNNLVSYYQMHGNSNDSVASNNGTDSSITYNTGNGKILQGAGFSTGSKIVIPGIASSFLSGVSFTIAGWFSISSTAVSRTVCKYFNVTNNVVNIEIFFRTDGKVEAYFQNTGGTYFEAITASAFDDGNFHLIVATYNHTTGDIKVNVDDGAGTGTAGSSGSKDTTTSLTANNWGQQESGGNQYDGKMDEIGVWSRVLTAGEITELYNGGAGITYPFTPTVGANSGFFEFM